MAGRKEKVKNSPSKITGVIQHRPTGAEAARALSIATAKRFDSGFGDAPRTRKVVAQTKTSHVAARNIDGLQRAQMSYSTFRRTVPTGYMDSKLTFEQNVTHNNRHLEFIGEFDKGGVGYRFLEAVYNKHRDKFVDDDGFRSKANFVAARLEDKRDPEKALGTALKRLSTAKTASQGIGTGG